MVTADATVLTERQVEVLELREEGNTQREVADRLGTTASNVSAVERAARDNVQKARHTLELVRTLSSPVSFSVGAGTYFDDLVDEVYDVGDETGIRIDYCRPELYTHLYALLEESTANNAVTAPVEVGITDDGDVKVFPDPS